MPGLDKRHYLPNPEDRKITERFHPIYKGGTINKKEFDRIEDLLQEITCDVTNGIPFSDIMIKLKQGGHYENQPKPVSYQTAERYLDAVKSRLSLDRNRDLEQVKDALYSQYLNLYRESMENGNHMLAKQVLDSLVKLYGIDKPTAPQTAIQVNDGKVEIRFGLNSEDKISDS